jgi:ABC-2 type transport system ATP-binding protein
MRLEAQTMSILEVKNLNKRYPKFQLKDVSFSLDEGYIMGFVGSNGAGKTTTLKSILGLVNADSGSVRIFGQDYAQSEPGIKPQIGFMFGGVDYYAKSRLGRVTNVIKRFYTCWDDAVYARYIKKFGLDEDKKLEELSNGMKHKYALTLALSHHAQLFILDEPTSGLDPVARDDLLELFQELIEDGKKSILFSTHITSDLEKCADYITYIENGRIIASDTRDDLLAAYRVVKGRKEQLGRVRPHLVSAKTHNFGFTGLIKTQDLQDGFGLSSEPPTIEDIMIYHAKKEAAQ